jgi:predicted MFS family arabinose efflux permease
MAHSYTGLLVVAVLAGAGNAIFHPADFTILNRRISPSRLGHAFAWHGLSGNIGWASGAALTAVIANWFGWQVAGFAAAALAAASLVILTWQAPALDHRVSQAESEGGVVSPQSTGGSLLGFLRSGTVWMCFVFFLLTNGSSGSLQSFAPQILSQLYDLGRGSASACLTTYLLGGAVGIFVGGFVAGKHRRSEQIVAIALALSTVLGALIAWGAFPVPVLFCLMFVMGGGIGMAGPNRDLMVRHAAAAQFGPSAFGRVYGFVYSGVDFGVALAPVMVGHIMDHGWFRLALLAIVAWQAAAVVMALGVGKVGIGAERRP